MKPSFIVAVALSLAAPAFADEEQGDVEKGAKEFGKCKACHSIANGDQVIAKGGKTGPNLYGVVGRVVGSEEEFRYSEPLLAINATGLVWTEEALADYVTDPNGWVKETTGDAGAKSKMTFKLKDGDDVAAYLASLSPAPAN